MVMYEIIGSHCLFHPSGYSNHELCEQIARSLISAWRVQRVHGVSWAMSLLGGQKDTRAWTVTSRIPSRKEGFAVVQSQTSSSQA